MPKRTTSYHQRLLEDLKDPQEAVYYLNAAIEERSEEMFLLALRDVAEAHQMAKVAEEAGVSRESLYRMLSDTGNPTYNSLTGILRALGLRLAVESEAAESEAPKTAPLAPEQVGQNYDGYGGNFNSFLGLPLSIESTSTTAPIVGTLQYIWRSAPKRFKGQTFAQPGDLASPDLLRAGVIEQKI